MNRLILLPFDGPTSLAYLDERPTGKLAALDMTQWVYWAVKPQHKKTASLCVHYENKPIQIY